MTRCSPTVLLGLLLCAAPNLASQAAAPPLASDEGEVFLYDEIDQRPKMLDGGPLFYPADPSAPRGKVVLRMVIDTNGTVDRGTIRVISSPDSAFTAAARAIVLNAHYRPGKLRDLKVRVLMQQELRFKPLTPPCDSVVVADGIRLCSLSRKGKIDR